MVKAQVYASYAIGLSKGQDPRISNDISGFISGVGYENLLAHCQLAASRKMDLIPDSRAMLFNYPLTVIQAEHEFQHPESTSPTLVKQLGSHHTLVSDNGMLSSVVENDFSKFVEGIGKQYASVRSSLSELKSHFIDIGRVGVYTEILKAASNPATPIDEVARNLGNHISAGIATNAINATTVGLTLIRRKYVWRASALSIVAAALASWTIAEFFHLEVIWRVLIGILSGSLVLVVGRAQIEGLIGISSLSFKSAFAQGFVESLQAFQVSRNLNKANWFFRLITFALVFFISFVFAHVVV